MGEVTAREQVSTETEKPKMKGDWKRNMKELCNGRCAGQHLPNNRGREVCIGSIECRKSAVSHNLKNANDR